LWDAWGFEKAFTLNVSLYYVAIQNRATRKRGTYGIENEAEKN